MKARTKSASVRSHIVLYELEISRPRNVISIMLFGVVADSDEKEGVDTDLTKQGRADDIYNRLSIVLGLNSLPINPI